MIYSLQLLRALVDTHPDRAAGLLPHVNALELAIIHEPGRCLERVRALFESTCHTIEPHLGLERSNNEKFSAQVARIIKALDFALEGHPDADKVGESIRQLLGSINGTIQALAQLSNIPGMRHGGSLDWRTLQRQHALMLGGLCDSLIAFLFDAAWSRAESVPVSNERYSDFSEFNAWFDEEHGDVQVASSVFSSSFVLFNLDNTSYDSIRREWIADLEAGPGYGAA